ncbi:MAG: FHA domain-containing protein [Actinomycetota bacterium]|nr:FHA domain-containing protein [Actinomycetota bacterium]MDH5277807.1 FHA domain-containing protein [Actinomycetota bacterium]
MSVCGACGHDNVEASARFCASCGQPLAAGPAPESAAETTGTLASLAGGEPEAEADAPVDLEAAAVERLGPGTALLVVRQGPAAGARFLLDAVLTTVGRHPDSEIFLDDITVSRRHAQFIRDDDAFRVHDVGSLNGTYVNRSRIDDAVLSNGDEVQIGKYRMVFVTGAAE